MKLDHIAIWAMDIELMRAFYEKYFDARSTRKYENERKRFTSYFLTFPGGGRLELMHRPDIRRTTDSQSSREFIGYAHLGVELGARAAVDALTKRLQGDGFPLLDGPRRTGDGYYESMVRIPKVTGLLSPNESAGPQPRRGALTATVRLPDRAVTL
jgi:lactoylglutathione lyase